MGSIFVELSLRIRFQHLLSVLARRIGKFSAAEHAGDFFGALFAGDGADCGASASGDLLLLDYIVVISKGRDLRQVGYAEHLAAARELFEFLADGFGSATANADIDFIKHDSSL